MKTIKIYKDSHGWNIETYLNGKLSEWRCGITKKAFDKYHSYYISTGYLCAASEREKIPFIWEVITKPNVIDDSLNLQLNNTF